MLNPLEKQHLAGFLGRLRDVMGNAGCNDYHIKVTPESRPMLIAIAEGYDEESREHHLKEAKEAEDGTCVCPYDWMVLHYLVKKLDLPKAPEGLGEREY